MEETMALEMRGLGLEVGMFVPAPSWEIFTMPKQGDSAAAAAGETARDKAATVGGMPKSASWSDFAFCSTDSVEVKTKPAASVEGRTKPAAASNIEPAAKVDGKKAEPKVVAIEVEEVPDSFIQHLLKNPPRRPHSRPEGFYEINPEVREADAMMNRLADMKDDILKQYRDKQRAVVKIEVLDNGRMRFYHPEKSTA
ncbi:unnamed protein product [Urochloa humidicola]